MSLVEHEIAEGGRAASMGTDPLSISTAEAAEGRGGMSAHVATLEKGLLDELRGHPVLVSVGLVRPEHAVTLAAIAAGLGVPLENAIKAVRAFVADIEFGRPATMSRLSGYVRSNRTSSDGHSGPRFVNAAPSRRRTGDAQRFIDEVCARLLRSKTAQQVGQVVSGAVEERPDMRWLVQGAAYERLGELGRMAAAEREACERLRDELAPPALVRKAAGT